MIIFNKSDLPKDSTFILSSSTEDETKTSRSNYQSKKQHKDINQANVQQHTTNILSKTNQEFLKKLGFQLKT